MGQEQNIPAGAGARLVRPALWLYALTITDLDPCAISLLLRAFSETRNASACRLDIDFCMDRPRGGDPLVGQDRYRARTRWPDHHLSPCACPRPPCAISGPRCLAMPIWSGGRLSNADPLSRASKPGQHRNQALGVRERLRERHARRVVKTPAGFGPGRVEGLLRKRIDPLPPVVIGDRPLDVSVAALFRIRVPICLPRSST